MSQFLFVEKNSVFHRLHPSGKIICLLLSFVFPLAFTDPRFILALWLIALPAGIASGAFQVLKRLKFLFSFIVIASFFLWLAFTPRSEPWFFLFGIKLSQPAIYYSAGMALRLGLMLFFGMVFIASTRVEELYYGLTRLGLPFAVSFALSLSFRLVPIFSESVKTILQAQRSRGLRTTGTPLQRFKSYFPLFVPVFLSALRKVDHLSIALEARGFGAGIKRTSWIQFRFSALDYLFLFLLIALTGGCFLLRFFGYGLIKF